MILTLSLSPGVVAELLIGMALLCGLALVCVAMARKCHIRLPGLGPRRRGKRGYGYERVRTAQHVRSAYAYGWTELSPVAVPAGNNGSGDIAIGRGDIASAQSGGMESGAYSLTDAASRAALGHLRLEHAASADSLD